ncbi:MULTISPECIES: ParB/RepB/Spo0J family partition protein [Sphingobacterium]|uniref:ParB/RepB/Spo0J family partition protein n=1 Tax=Sphingobacterium TaxID=28453 RepID=UPI00257AF4E6|nr:MULTISPECIES: ParB N-terminal domain-containing protein [Sphingobacterium]
MKQVKNIEEIVGKTILYDNATFKISNYSVDGLMMTINTDKGPVSFLKSQLATELAKMQLGEQQLMQSTTDYDIFGHINSNRKIDKRHVKTLVNLISKNNLLHLNPLIVDGYNRVVDGQHRLEAAKLLKVPVYFIKDTGVNKTDIATLNSNKKNWSLIDYINFHTEEGKPGFKALHNFMSLYPMLPVSSALSLLSTGGRHDTAAIREGSVDVNNADQAEEIAEFLVWLHPMYDSAYSGSVASVIRRMFNAEGFDQELFKSKIQGQPRSLVKCINRKQYLEMFLEIYNYKLSLNRLTVK